MKRAWTYILFIGATLSVLAISFALPHLTGAVQDNVMGSETSKQSIQEITLVTPGSEESMTDLLVFASQGYMSTQYISPSLKGESDTKISSAPLDTKQKATDFFETLNEHGVEFVDPARLDELSSSSFLATSADGETARLLWRYDAWDEKGNTYASLIIDDATGKVIAFTFEGNHTGLTTWLDALTQYYGFKDGELSKSKMFFFTDSSGNSVECDFFNTGDSVQFNPISLESLSKGDVSISTR